MENGGYNDVLIAIFLKILVGELIEHADSRNVLNEVAALTVADGDIANALLSGKKRLNDSNGMGDTCGNEGACQGP
jgi:hypothetical protein